MCSLGCGVFLVRAPYLERFGHSLGAMIDFLLHFFRCYNGTRAYRGNLECLELFKKMIVSSAAACVCAYIHTHTFAKPGNVE